MRGNLHFIMTQLFCGLLYLVLPVVSDLINDCKNEISPSALVVRYGDSAVATCRALAPVHGMGWESTVGATGMEEGVTELNWTVKELKEWTLEPLCFLNPVEGDQCTRKLPVVVYKMPDSVSLTEDDSEPKSVGRLYTFTCLINNVAPVQNLIVKLFRGEEKLNETTEHRDDRTGPQNTTFTWEYSFSTDDDGAEYRCEAGLDVTSEPLIQSQPVLITVHYAPQHDQSEVEVLVLESDTKLNCTVSGNPLPEYAWTLSGTHEKAGSQPILSVTQSGDYTCTASNKLGSSSKHFRVEARSSGTFWTIIIVGAAVAVFLMVGYGIYKWRSGPNSII